MNRYEFLIRFSMLHNRKPTKIRQYLNQLENSDDIDDALLLSKLNLDANQTTLFYQNDIGKILDWINKEHHYLISYPDRLYPEQLKQISSPPLLLFGIGNRALLSSPQIAMVGSRQFSQYGAQWGRYFARELAVNGLTITSGLALGIDAICHRGALEALGNTIAVLGSGLGHITPKTNYRLAQDILANNGTIISEFLPHQPGRPQYYPRRNRIISGLSLGTFVVEASEKSGSLITARYALEQNRDVFALPGEIANENCHGTHWLIKQGAYLVSTPADILEHYSGHLLWIKKQSEKHAKKVSAHQVAKQHIDSFPIIHADILAVINHQPIPVDIIADKTGQSVADVAVKLTELELEGLIKTVSGGYIRNGLP